jgi:predicted DNA-binding mobile mystery protein A
MKDAIRHLDQRFESLRPFGAISRPPKGWVRAIRDALGMTTAQLARRLGVSQPRVVELEQSEVSGSITLHTLQRAAEALGCRLTYILVPEKALAETVRARAESVAQKQLESVQQTMRLENQSVTDNGASDRLRNQLIEKLLSRPARLWDDK